jgi:adenosylhomocysteine nucleosidase
MVLRFLLRNWLQGLARDKIREKVVETAQGKMDEMREDFQAKEGRQAADVDLSVDVGAVFALPIEAGGTADLLDAFHTTRGSGFVAQLGQLAGRKLALFESGAGASRAAAATEALIETHRPRWVISAGFAGGLIPSLKRHDIVMADSVENAAGRCLGIDLKIDPATLPPGVHVGRILSVDRIARLPSEKESLGRRHEALAVDLESFAVAEVCRRRAVRFLGVRIIIDTMDEQLPVDIQHLTDQTTSASRLGAALGSVCRRPSSLKDMLQLKENALVGSDRLAHFLDGTIRQLAPVGEGRDC